jgi:YD repeat-containing protein
LIPGVTPKNLPALRKHFFCLLLAVFSAALAAQSTGAGIRWYRSNSSGMALELISSGAAAMRNEFCLSVQAAAPGELPSLTASYYADSYAIELRVLYENGGEIRRQWIFRDRGVVRFSASGSGGLFQGGAGSGFIEVRNAEGATVLERRYEEDLSEWEFRFAYDGNTLLRAEIWHKEAPGENEGDNAFVPVAADYYRYSRSGSLRAIDRLLREGADISRVAFPRPGVSPEGGDINYGIAYTSEFLLNVLNRAGAQISYTLDGRGRVLAEVWKDENGRVLGEITNTWSDNRLISALWKSEDDERRVEFEYDGSGNRTGERNFRRGVLERSVLLRGGRETEEIYMNGRLILRIIWEGGVKISEERVNP